MKIFIERSFVSTQENKLKSKLKNEDKKTKFTSISQGLFKKNQSVFIFLYRFERNPRNIKCIAAKKKKEKFNQSVKFTKYIHCI